MANYTREDVEELFAAELEAKGCGQHLIPADGQWHKFAVPGEIEEKGSAILNFKDGKINGYAKDWRSNEPILKNWKPNGAAAPPVDPELREKVRLESYNIYHTLKAAKADHPYAVRKGIKDLEPLRHDPETNTLVVPIFNAKTGDFQAIEYIDENGDKKVPKDATVAGGCVVPGCYGLKDLDKLHERDGRSIVTCEGFATGYSIHDALNGPAVCARYCGNLLAVTKAMRERYPLRPQIVAGDNGKAGTEAATKAALAVTRCKVVFPPDKYDDFNDMYLAEGPEAVAKWIEAKAYEPKPERLTQTSEEFVAGYEPPDYIIDGMLQQGFFYCLTAPTNRGKTAVMLLIAIHIALGLPIAGHEVLKGRVLYFAGENPDDIRMRWILLCNKMKIDPKDVDVVFLPGTPDIFNPDIRQRIDQEIKDHGPLTMVMVDTSMAYFQGDDENGTQLLEHAKRIRDFTNMYGRPCTLVATHPIKRWDETCILPRGAGLFINEVDGNLVLLREPGSDAVQIYWHHKMRGNFEPFSFKIIRDTCERLVTKKGRSIITVYAEFIAETEKEMMDEASRSKEDELVLAMKANPKASLQELADVLGWKNKNIVYRLIVDKLIPQRMVKKNSADQYELTKRGTENAEGVTNAPPKIGKGITKDLALWHETDKAYLFSDTADTDSRFWLPKAVVKAELKPDEPDRRPDLPPIYAVTMPAWTWTRRKKAEAKAAPPGEDEAF